MADSMHDKRVSFLAAGLRLAVGLTSIALLFAFAIGITRFSPFFGVHAIALERRIDTSALYYTDIEEFARAEHWVAIHLDRDGSFVFERTPRK
jgi:hypothetical protein